MLSFSVLSSGSKANCIYVGNAVTRVLVDCGMSARETARRLGDIGIAADSIDAVIVTHEHRDHVAGAGTFAARHKVPVLLNGGTHDAWAEQSDLSKISAERFQTGESFAFGGLTVESFSISHDAADPVGIKVSYGGNSLVIVTDLGQVTALVREKVKGASALILESNHDPVLLKECMYPWPLKQRIAGRHGHLSNQSACALLKEVNACDNGRLRVVVGAHVSENSNHPHLVRDGFEEACSGKADRPEIVVADIYMPTDLFTVD